MSRLTPTAWLAAGGLAAALLTLPHSALALDPAPSGASGPTTAFVPREDAPITLHLRDIPLRTALQMLFEGTGFQHAVEPTVPNVPVTLDIRDVPFQTALRTMLRLAPGITYRKESEIYIVGLRQPVPERPAYDAEIPAPPEALAGDQVAVAEKIPIKYLHPAVVAYILNGQLIPTEDQFQSGAGGYGGGINGGGYNGLGNNAYGNLNGGGLGPTGGGFPGGALNGYGNGAGISGAGGSFNSFGGYNQGLSSNGFVNGTTNSAVLNPRIRRF